MTASPHVLVLKIIERANLRNIQVTPEYLVELFSKMREDKALILYDDAPENATRNYVSTLKFLDFLIESKDGPLFVTPSGVRTLDALPFSVYEKDVIEKYIC